MVYRHESDLTVDRLVEKNQQNSPIKWRDPSPERHRPSRELCRNQAHHRERLGSGLDIAGHGV